MGLRFSVTLCGNCVQFPTYLNLAVRRWSTFFVLETIISVVIKGSILLSMAQSVRQLWLVHWKIFLTWFVLKTHFSEYSLAYLSTAVKMNPLCVILIIIHFSQCLMHLYTKNEYWVTTGWGSNTIDFYGVLTWQLCGLKASIRSDGYWYDYTIV